MNSAEIFANELKSALGENLISAVLYGSAVSGDTTRKYSDVDIFLLLRDTSLNALQPALPLIRKWVKSNNKPPLLFSEAHFQRAADVFAIEFAEIKDQRRVLIGSDPFSEIRIERAALRHQLEFELRSVVLRLRRHYVETGDKPKQLAEILAQSLSTLSALFRSTLRLINEPAPASKKQAWQALNRHVPMDMAALEKIWDLRAHGPTLDQKTADTLFQSIVTAVESVINFVDLQK